MESESIQINKQSCERKEHTIVVLTMSPPIPIPQRDNTYLNNMYYTSIR